MKLRYIFASLIALLGVAVACEKEADTYLSGIKVSTSYFSLPAEGGSVTLTLNAKDSWQFEKIFKIASKDAEGNVIKDAEGKDVMVDAVAPDWLTIDPASGDAGEITVTFTATAATETRETSLMISSAGKTQTVNVIQMTEKVEKLCSSMTLVLSL